MTLFPVRGGGTRPHSLSPHSARRLAALTVTFFYACYAGGGLGTAPPGSCPQCLDSTYSLAARRVAQRLSPPLCHRSSARASTASSPSPSLRYFPSVLGPPSHRSFARSRRCHHRYLQMAPQLRVYLLLLGRPELRSSPSS